MVAVKRSFGALRVPVESGPRANLTGPAVSLQSDKCNWFRPKAGLGNLRIQLLLVALFLVIFVLLCEDTLCFRPVAAQRLTPILPWIPQLPQQALSCS